MARKRSKNRTKLKNETGETITLVAISASGHRSTEITTVETDGEHEIWSDPSDTGRLLEVCYGNKSTNIIITSDDLLQNIQLTITKKPPPPAMNFEVVKRSHAHPQI